MGKATTYNQVLDVMQVVLIDREKEAAIDHTFVKVNALYISEYGYTRNGLILIRDLSLKQEMLR